MHIEASALFFILRSRLEKEDMTSVYALD